MIKRALYFCSLLLLLCIGCTDNEQVSIKDQVQNLNTVQLRNIYLQDLMYRDQVHRRMSDSIVRTYGYDSDQHLANIQEMMKEDSLNLVKIGHFLDIHGYPDPSTYSQTAMTAPWMIVHHQPNNGSREEFFPIFYKAYKEGKMSSSDFAFFLGRMHDMTIGGRIHMEGKFTDEMEIDTLIKAMNLSIDEN